MEFTNNTYYWVKRYPKSDWAAALFTGVFHIDGTRYEQTDLHAINPIPIAPPVPVVTHIEYLQDVATFHYKTVGDTEWQEKEIDDDDLFQTFIKDEPDEMFMVYGESDGEVHITEREYYISQEDMVYPKEYLIDYLTQILRNEQV